MKKILVVCFFYILLTVLLLPLAVTLLLGGLDSGAADFVFLFGE